MKIINLKNYSFNNTGTRKTLILAAGFEIRNIATLKYFNKKGINIDKIGIFDYPDKNDNEPTRSKVIGEASKLSDRVYIFDILNPNEHPLKEILKRDAHIYIDITGMSRVYIFRLLNLVDSNNNIYSLLYTEAETYFPRKKFFDQLTDNKRLTILNYEKAFTKYLYKEKAEIVYSYDCDIVQEDPFLGYPEPGKPLMLVAFVTFKRSRLQVILQKFEFENKFFLLSEPVREDIKWRKDYLKLANYDLLTKNSGNVKTIQTLYPNKVIKHLEKIIYNSYEFARYNIMLAPLGSKLQTIACYYFWQMHPDISIVFSQPKKYFKNTYSASYRDSFIILPNISIRQKYECKTKF